jgi:23S rRNA (adenine2503-C2)-methyltransferase
LCVNALHGGNLAKRAITNLVLMGSGEPLDNYDNVITFLRNVSAEGGINISPRNISLSTCGLVDKIYSLAQENLPVNLTISLHNTTDEERARTMPIANKWKISEILDACTNYFNKTGRRYIFEYSLIEGENCDKRHADELIALLKGRPCHVNLIRLNEVKERSLKALGEKQAYAFLGMLEKGGLSATLRRQIGADIGGACGQLRAGYLNEEGNLTLKNSQKSEEHKPENKKEN